MEILPVPDGGPRPNAWRRSSSRFTSAPKLWASLPEETFVFPLTQQHIADALGLSLVHTNKTLARLRRLGMFKRANGTLTLTNPRVLDSIGQYYEQEIALRPLI
jgi:hypothetical protein